MHTSCKSDKLIEAVPLSPSILATTSSAYFARTFAASAESFALFNCDVNTGMLIATSTA